MLGAPGGFPSPVSPDGRVAADCQQNRGSQDNRLVLTERLADPIARLRIEDQAIDPS
jgi:hypothetical protein